MRIAIPVVSGEVFSPLANAEAFHFYEDDHGKIVREFLEPMEESSTDAAVGLLERYGIDALLCGTIDDTERTAVGMAGIMLFPGYSGKAEVVYLLDYRCSFIVNNEIFVLVHEVAIHRLACDASELFLFSRI